MNTDPVLLAVGVAAVAICAGVVKVSTDSNYAISLENKRLHRELEDAFERIRRLEVASATSHEQVNTKKEAILHRLPQFQATDFDKFNLIAEHEIIEAGALIDKNYIKAFGFAISVSTVYLYLAATTVSDEKTRIVTELMERSKAALARSEMYRAMNKDMQAARDKRIDEELEAIMKEHKAEAAESIRFAQEMEAIRKEREDEEKAEEEEKAQKEKEKEEATKMVRFAEETEDMDYVIDAEEEVNKQQEAEKEPEAEVENGSDAGSDAGYI